MFENKKPVLTDIKVIKCQINGRIVFSIGTEDASLVINKYTNLGMLVSKNGFIEYTDLPIEVIIDNDSFYLRDDNILLSSNIAIDLNNKCMYVCDADEFEALKTNLSDRKKIILKNELDVDVWN
jgi:hypothetical protein